MAYSKIDQAVQLGKMSVNEATAYSHIYHPDNVDRIIDTLNDVLNDETKMRLVFECPVLQQYLRPTDPTIPDPE